MIILINGIIFYLRDFTPEKDQLWIVIFLNVILLLNVAPIFFINSVKYSSNKVIINNFFREWSVPIGSVIGIKKAYIYLYRIEYYDGASVKRVLFMSHLLEQTFNPFDRPESLELFEKMLTGIVGKGSKPFDAEITDQK
ncbi:MAG: hypothetical protein JST14_13735 [Bacteroidetes bacterium]|nr:hypothetical protein [Bacteroidota bacterium]MBS1975886.1 hypothetical protein [Bacteroidota bacterium]